MQYAETLPLRDHEVVLSFDDGPLPHNSDQVLAILAAQCIKANFFIIGQMARTFPEGVRKLRDAGHTIGTHTQTHPLSMNRMPIERAKAEIDDGIASVKAALGADADKSLAPFFRIPGLLRARSCRGLSRLAGHPDLERRFPGRRLAAYFVAAGLRSRHPADRGQGKRHSAASRHPGADGRGAAADPANAESARLQHRPRGAGDAGASCDADRTATMAIASDVGNRGDLALAQNTQFRFCRRQ